MDQTQTRSGSDKESSVPRLANWAVIGIFLILAFAAIAEGRDFLMPATMAVLLFFVFTPLRRLAERRGLPNRPDRRGNHPIDPALRWRDRLRSQRTAQPGDEPNAGDLLPAQPEVRQSQ